MMAHKKRVGMEVSIAVSHAVQLARAEAIAAYPITPQTHIVEHLSSLVANGDLEAEFVTVESEHSAMSTCIGMRAAGARTYTATSSQGLALMNEILFIASAMRLPIVMTVANRALSGPLSIWNDHGDIMAARDIGWIQIFAENGQEAFDHSIMAFKIAEDHRVILPTIVNLDGFILTHVVEAHEMMDQETVDRFLPPLVPYHKLDPAKPVTMGAFAMPELFTECKMAHQMALTSSYGPILEVWKEWGELTGRHYKPVEILPHRGGQGDYHDDGLPGRSGRNRGGRHAGPGHTGGAGEDQVVAALPLCGVAGRPGRGGARRRLRPGPVPGRRRRAGPGGSAQRHVSPGSQTSYPRVYRGSGGPGRAARGL